MNIKITHKKRPFLFEVNWAHFNVAKLATRVGADESIRKDRSGKTYTVCVVRGTSGTSARGNAGCLGTGEAVVHPRDEFDIEKGRKIALARALESAYIPKRERTRFWKRYFGK